MTTNTNQQVAQSETLEQIATKVVNQIAVGAWQYCSRQWVIGLVTEALRNERERCAKVAEKHFCMVEPERECDCQSQIEAAIREGR